MNYFVDDDGKQYQLQKCPFCGMSVAVVIPESELKEEPKSEEYEMFTVCCAYNQGGCGATCGYHNTKQKAVSRWNTRVVI